MSVRDGILAELKELGLEDSGEGQSALVLAGRLDSESEEQASGLASVARELRLQMSELRARPKSESKDPLERLQGKRDERRS